MAIEIEKDFEVPAPPEEVWAFLVDPERVVKCLPGASLLEQLDDRTYRGEVGLKLGPIGATFEGTMRFDSLDEEDFRVEMSGSGRDRKGSGSVEMSMRSHLEPTSAGGTRVEVSQTVTISGRLASFGRGGMIQNVADHVFGRFTDCVKEELGG